MSIISYDAFCTVFGDHAPYRVADGGGDMHLQEAGWVTSVEASVLVALTAFARCERFVEIGVAKGGTAKGLLDRFPSIKEYVGIDVPFGFATVPVQQREVQRVPGELALGDPRFRSMVLEGGTRELLEKDVPRADAVFVDADHSYEGAKRDTELARRMVGKGRGVIMWHDFTNCEGVRRCLAEENDGKWPHPVCLVDGTSVCFELVGPWRDGG